MLRYFLIGDRKDNWNSNDHKARTNSVKIPSQKGPWTKLQWTSIITVMSLLLKYLPSLLNETAESFHSSSGMDFSEHNHLQSEC